MANFLILFKEIDRMRKLENRRHPFFYQKRAMKVFAGVMTLLIIAYLCMGGILLQEILATEHPSMASYHLFHQGMVFLCVVDFSFRFMGQSTPGMKAKPFLLLPVPRKRIIDCFLLKAGLNTTPCIWFAFLMPFALKAILPYYGWSGLPGYLLGWWLMLTANSYFYLAMRTLIIRRWIWLLLPYAFYTLLLTLALWPETPWMAYAFMWLGEGWIEGNLGSYLVPLAIITGLFRLNEPLQDHAAYYELAGTPQKKGRKANWQLNTLNRYGLTGECVKMEIKSILRNRTVKVQFWMAVGMTVLFSLLLTFSPDVYGTKGNAFFCYYCFFTMASPLLHTLNVEGNYMDGIMTRKGMLTHILQGKYFFNVLIEVLPFLLLLPTVCMGTITLLQSVAYFMVTAGFCIPVSMHSSLFTNYAAPLNKKLTESNGSNKVGLTLVIMSLLVLLPIGIEFLLTWLISQWVADTVLILAGLTGILTYKRWLSQLYTRVYARRHNQMEGFRKTRQS